MEAKELKKNNQNETSVYSGIKSRFLSHGTLGSKDIDETRNSALLSGE